MASSASEDYRPLIGLTTYLEPSRHGIWEVVSTLLPAAYAQGVSRAGGRPVLVPPLEGWSAAEVGDLDALVLTGGSDVGPETYGQVALDTTAPPQAGRDAAELELIAAARSAGLPLLGICRGLQMLNVAAGGTLHQHLPDAVGHSGHQISPAVFSDTSVAFDRDSVLGSLLGDQTTVRCYHHQAVDELGAGLRVSARAPDGTIEGVERAAGGGSFVLGVQWHPEENLDDLRLFRALIRTAREWRLSGGPEGRER